MIFRGDSGCFVQTGSKLSFTGDITLIVSTIKLPAIDALRGLAAIGVAWFHSRSDLWVGYREIKAHPENFSALDQALAWFSLPVSQMGSLVMLFFVLSGFCIHLSFADSAKPMEIVPYAIRRLFRIVPAYWFALACCWVIPWILSPVIAHTNQEEDRYLASAFMLQNWWFDGAQISLNPSLWSIPVEIEFYVFYPLLLSIHRKYGLRGLTVLTVICTSIGLGLYGLGMNNANGSFFKYSLIWNAGAWLADKFKKSGRLGWSTSHAIFFFCSLALTLVAVGLSVPVFFLHYGWGVCAFLGLWWVISQDSSPDSQTEIWIRILAPVGTLSYSLYLIHYPFFRVLGHIWVALFQTKPSSFLVPSVATLAVLPIAWLMFHAIERPGIWIGQSILNRFRSRRSRPELSP
jgi:peptidoglycan/LPS O-acetylase OafA/YrhL